MNVRTISRSCDFALNETHFRQVPTRQQNPNLTPTSLLNNHIFSLNTYPLYLETHLVSMEDLMLLTLKDTWQIF